MNSYCNTVSAANLSIGALNCYVESVLCDNSFLSDALRGNLLLKHYQLEVDLRHVSMYNDEMAHMIQDRPADILPLVQLQSSPRVFSLTHLS
jgi:hypothetical protein